MSGHEEILARWRSGEEQLYPVATTRPDLYEACIDLVRALVEHLESIPDLDALVTSYRVTGVDDEYRRAGVDPAAQAPEIDLGRVRDAAYQVRSRRLAVVEAGDRTQRAIRRGRADGERVVTIWSEGENEHWPPFRRVEMSLASGAALVRTVALDPDTMTPLWRLEQVALDPETGEALAAEPLAPPREFTDPDAWRAAAEELRRVLLKD